MVLMSELPNPRGSQLLRRLDELRRGEGRVELGKNPEQDSLDLVEFVGDNAIRSVTFGRKPLDERDAVEVLYGLLNRRDVFMDFTTLCDIGPQWLSEASEMCIGVWNFIWQVILTTELARRLEKGHGLHSGFTVQVLASLIVSELWSKNIQLVLVDAPVDLPDGVEEPIWRQRAKARDVATRADEALKANSLEESSELYEEVLREASAWKQLAPEDAQAWSLIGRAWQGLENAKQAIAAYTCAGQRERHISGPTNRRRARTQRRAQLNQHD
jgi:tetratricopeptide (TPR) repeat protein